MYKCTCYDVYDHGIDHTLGVTYIALTMTDLCNSLYNWEVIIHVHMLHTCTQTKYIYMYISFCRLCVPQRKDTEVMLGSPVSKSPVLSRSASPSGSPLICGSGKWGVGRGREGGTCREGGQREGGKEGRGKVARRGYWLSKCASSHPDPSDEGANDTLSHPLHNSRNSSPSPTLLRMPSPSEQPHTLRSSKSTSWGHIKSNQMNSVSFDGTLQSPATLPAFQRSLTPTPRSNSASYAVSPGVCVCVCEVKWMLMLMYMCWK